MPFLPSFFKDLNKRSSDLITKDFPSEKKENKVDWKGEVASSNVTFETSFTQKNDGSILGIFSPKYKIKDWNATVSGELKTNKDFKAEVSVEDKFAPGLKTILSGESKSDDLITALGVEYKHEVATFTANLDYGPSGSNIKSSAVLGTQGFQFGASLDYFVGSSNDSSLKEVNAIASYSTGEFDLGFFGKILNEKDSTILGANYFHKVSKDFDVGAQISFDTQNPDTKPNLVAAASYRVDPDATVKTKFDTNGKLGLSYQQKFKSSRFTLSGTVDTNNLSGKNASSVGFNLSLF